LAYFPHGIFRITAAAPTVSVANPVANALASIRQIEQTDADLILLPELGLTGYSCGDLFASDALLDAALSALHTIADHSASHESIVVVGLPLSVDSALMNVAAIVSAGSVVGIVPKTFMPTYREFYELRHFQGARDVDPESVEIDGDEVPFGTDLLFRWGQATIGIEICEDLWTPIQPSAMAARCECIAEPFGQQRNDWKGGLASRLGAQPIGALYCRVCLRIGWPWRVLFRLGVWWSLHDRRERSDLARVSPRR